MSDDRRGLRAVQPGEAPTSAGLLTAVGGVRGVLESLLPGLAFLVAFAIVQYTAGAVVGQALVLVVAIPVAVAVLFLAVRLIQRQSPTSAIAGVVGVAISAAFAIFFNDANANFVPGLIINAAFLLATAVTLAVRWPLVGLFAGVFTEDARGWRDDPAKRRSAAAATWVWAGLFAIRLAVELPLYLAGLTAALAGAKLVLGLPLYAGALWITWLLLRRSWAQRRSEPGESATEV